MVAGARYEPVQMILEPLSGSWRGSDWWPDSLGPQQSRCRNRYRPSRVAAPRPFLLRFPLLTRLFLLRLLHQAFKIAVVGSDDHLACPLHCLRREFELDRFKGGRSAEDHGQDRREHLHLLLERIPSSPVEAGL